MSRFSLWPHWFSPWVVDLSAKSRSIQKVVGKELQAHGYDAIRNETILWIRFIISEQQCALVHQPHNWRLQQCGFALVATVLSLLQPRGNFKSTIISGCSLMHISFFL